MSLILEALRKSEAERLRGRAPDLHAALSLPRSASEPPRHWGRIAGILLLAGIGAAAFVWRDRIVVDDATVTPTQVVVTRPDVASTTTTTTATAAAQIEIPQPATALARSAAPASAARHASASPATRKVPTDTPPAAKATTSPAAIPGPVQAVAATERAGIAPASRNPDDSSLRRLGDLDSVLRGHLPALKVSMHVWNDDPQQRFALIDGQRLGEGAQIGDALIERIDRDGVVLAWRGERLLLPRP